MPASTAYWKAKSGEEYKRQQLERGGHGNTSYKLQIEWLVDRLTKMAAERPGAPLKVLDFGCGFGRAAEAVSEISGVDYYGFDISEGMVRPLLENPPKSLAGVIGERVHLGPDLRAAFSEIKFDVIFTISVFIHNTPDTARTILSAMADRLEPAGQILLVENPFSPVTVLENFWHAGCWLHSFANYVDGILDLDIVDSFAGGRHALYILAHPAEPDRSRFSYRANFASPVIACTRDDLQRLEIHRAFAAAENLSHEVFVHLNATADAVGKARDLQELLTYSTQREEILRSELNRLRDENAELREAFAQRRQVAERREQLVRSIHESLQAVRSKDVSYIDSPSGLRGHAEPVAHWNAAQDRCYSHQIPELENVLHIFHQEWYGIRAASGSLPGMKLAIAANTPMAGFDHKAAIDNILAADPERIVVHGMSDNMAVMVRILARIGFTDKLFLVHHGSPTQWVYQPERRYAFTHFELAREGLVRKLHIMKPDFDLPVDCLFRPMLFNMSPNLRERSINWAGQPPKEAIAFIPGWRDFHKNIFTNAMGAALTDRIKEVWTYASDVELPSSLSQKIRAVPFVDRESTFRLFELASLTMNVSLVDCHPMLNLESQALGTPCLRGPLFLDALEDHPYVKLTSVSDPTSPRQIKEAVERVLQVSEHELRDMIFDYQAASDRHAIDRYREFLEI